MLMDRFARRFTYLRLSITESCNFRCEYCLPNGPDCHSRKFELTVPEIRRLVTAFAALGTKKVRITGGEPCLRKDLLEIIETVAAVPGIEEVAITTNGYRLQRDVEAWRAAGVTAINVSVDSLDPSTFHLVTGQNKLPEILAGIDQAIALGFPKVKINSVLLKGYNDGTLAQFLDYVRDRDVSLRFIELMRTNDNVSYYQRHHMSGATLEQKLLNQGWQKCQKSTTAGPAKEYRHAEYVGKIGLIMPYSRDFCDDCNRLRVSSLGQLFLCLFTEHHRDLRAYLDTDDTTPLQHALQQMVLAKKATHELHQNTSGATRHLAMIGG